MEDFRYTLTIGPEDAIGPSGKEFLMFQLLRDVADAKQYLNADGKPAGNGYDWRDLADNVPTNSGQSMRTFSKKFPNLLFQIDEDGVYDGDEFHVRHYFKDGKYARLEPEVVVTWPEFTEDLLAPF